VIHALLATLATIGATVAPTAAGPLTFNVKVTATTESTQKAYALVHSAATPCAASFSADQGKVIVGGAPVSGTVSISHDITVKPGSYVVCSWLGTGAPQSTTFTTPTECVVPRAPVTLAKARTRLTAAGCSVGKLTHARSATVRSGRVIRYGTKPGEHLKLGAAVGIVVSRGAKASASALSLRYFKTPSANIVCQYGSGDPQFPPSMECAIKSGLKPPPKRKKCDAGDYTDSMVFMELTGHANYLRCAGDPGPLVGEAKAKVLAYGKTWRRGDMRCTSRTSGLTCRNRSGHGWNLSRVHSKLV
jgi:hypothetical protein